MALHDAAEGDTKAQSFGSHSICFNFKQKQKALINHLQKYCHCERQQRMPIPKMCLSVLSSERDKSLMGKYELEIFARTLCMRKWTAIKTFHRFLLLCSLRVDVSGCASEMGLVDCLELIKTMDEIGIGIGAHFFKRLGRNFVF